MNWTKKSIFYELSYWSELELKYNMNVMHREKNVYENLLGTMLRLEKKNHDTEKARFDSMVLKIKTYLHLREQRNGWYKLLAAYIDP